MMNEKQLVVDGLLTKYIESGNGKMIIIFLHGWGDDAQTFTGLMVKFPKETTIYSINLPGFGGTDSPEEVWGLSDYANFVAEFIAKLKLKPHAIIGHSNGGAIAVRAIATNKIITEKLVLLASAGVRDVYKGKKRALRYVAKVAKLATKPLPRSTQNKLKKKAYSAIGSDLFVAEHMQETFKKVVTDDVTDEAELIQIPTLLIYGSNDTATPPSYGKLFANKINGSRLEIIEGAGHFVFKDAEDDVVTQIGEFLA